MGLFDFMKGKPKQEETDPTGARVGSADESYEPLPELPVGKGGPSPVANELTHLRLAAVSEAINVARSEPDPANWRDGQMQFEIERSTAHAYEAVRDQISNHVASQLATKAAFVYDTAIAVGLARERLRDIDHDLEQATEDWSRKFAQAQHDQMELGRYYRGTSTPHFVWKVLIAVVLVAVELVMTASLFTNVFPELDLGPIVSVPLAFGIIILLIVVPYLAAIGIKEGTSPHYSFVEDQYRAAEQVPPVTVQQLAEREQQEDSVFKKVSAAMATVLLVVIFPLSWLRAVHIESDLAPTWVWFALFFLTQMGISLYFFLREWLDYGPFSHDLIRVTERRDELEGRRADAVASLAEPVSMFHRGAEDLLFVLQEAPRWDSYVVESYLATIHQCRHIIGMANPEIRPFIVGAIVPYMGTQEEAAESSYPLAPLSLENADLEGGRFSRRQWRVQLVGEGWRAELEDTDDESELEDTDVLWMITKSPVEMLEEVLRRYFDLPATYTRPAIFDEVHRDEDPPWLSPVFDPIPNESAPDDSAVILESESDDARPEGNGGASSKPIKTAVDGDSSEANNGDTERDTLNAISRFPLADGEDNNPAADSR